ncbi:chitin deacetylase [Paracoccus suum]|uniref:Chitooligosaccharide deacetylase n=1 Tax=Paracoccus suum TaxID=2259340 RepID=A0A344PGC5_9RHOB|nr:polysaccharide deacetylase family protein [Paracoccus suum]AXC48430.1 chitin deacetylase [Paracoccus suum]
MDRHPRDLIGYGRQVPQITWPNGARVAVNFVLNYEEGSEYAMGDGDGRSDATLTEVSAPRVPVGQRDLAAESMFEYGSRVGFWRIHRLFAERGLPLTIFASALALERNPEAAAALRETDWDAVCHGWRWVEHYLLDEATEREHIARGHAVLTKLLGRPPEGFYCRYGPSLATRRLVVEHGGFSYDSDAYNDELPYWTEVGTKPHLVVPYSLATNDSKLVSGPLVSGRTFGEFLIDSFEGMRAEADLHPRMMSVGMHSRVVAHPGRMVGIAMLLDHLQGRDDVWICRRADLAAHWRTVVPAPQWREVAE